MKRTSVTTKAADLFGTGKDGFTDGVPSVTASTVLESSVMNAHQEEIARAIEANGTALRAAAYDQLARVSGFRHALAALLNPAGTLDTSGSDAMNGVACNDLGTVVFVGDGGKIFTMDAFDGSTLASRTAGSSYTGDFLDVCWTGTLFVAVGRSGEVQTSPTGVTWTRRVTSGGVAGTSDLRGVAKGPTGRLVAAGGSSPGVNITSTDGTAWTANATLASFTCGHVVVDPNTGVWLIRGSTRTAAFARSTTGTSFTVIDLSTTLAVNNGPTDVAAAGSGAGGFVSLVGDNVGVQEMIVSDDGLTWTVVSLNSTTTDLCLAAERGGYVLLPQDIPGLGYISSDGWTWQGRWFANSVVLSSRLKHLSMNGTRIWIALGKDADAGKMTKTPLWGL